MSEPLVAAAMSEVHVVPVRRTAKGRVQDGDPFDPSSEHDNETEAELARADAQRNAVPRGMVVRPSA